MIRGTRIIEGNEALAHRAVTSRVATRLRETWGYEEISVPALWEQQTFIDKAGAEIIDQMYAFQDKKARPICLIPEVTGIVQEMWNTDWSKRYKTRRVFYIARCYRYERPQAGRYREFTQIGIELLGGKGPEDRNEVVKALRDVIEDVGVTYEFADAVKRGLAYYTEDGFEAICPQLGAQKQVAGGGRYAEGIGWAIGLDRLVLARATP